MAASNAEYNGDKVCDLPFFFCFFGLLLVLILRE